MSLEISVETTFLLDMVNQTYGPELHTDANAASDPNGNEANATTGWTALNNAILTSVGSPVSVGSYAMEIECNSTPTSQGRCRKVFTVENGVSYFITFDWRHIGTGGIFNFNVDSVVQDTIDVGETTYESKEFTVVASSTSMTCQFSENSATDDGGVYFDNFSFRKIL